uniref:Small ribosomal subunit protein uS17 n=1 Tax=Nannospalax galili TaxID=1026970 RepID=A0A8C6RWM8_NANGA
MVDIQTELAYQKQLTTFRKKKRVLLGETGKEKLPWYYKNIGLGFKTPKKAIEGIYIDKKCPSPVTSPSRTYLHYIQINQFKKCHKNMSVYLSLCFRDVQIGDIITVGECRPLSKTVHFNKLKAASTKKQFQKF